jgi:hypothetical protein
MSSCSPRWDRQNRRNGDDKAMVAVGEIVDVDDTRISLKDKILYVHSIFRG